MTAREKVAEELYKQRWYAGQPSWEDSLLKHLFRVYAGQISALIVDEDAELPGIRLSEPRDSAYNYKYYAFGDICKAVQKDMRDAGYRLVGIRRNDESKP
jgi:hypothetical protein